MRFAWNRATADDSSSEPLDGPHATSTEDELSPIQLLLADTGPAVGWIATGGQRTSDWLNAHRDGVPAVGLTGGDTVPAVAPQAGTPELIEPRRIVWVVPPPLPPNRHLRLHRRRVLVHLQLDEYEVSGQAHVRPGADAVDQVLRGTRDLVPLTEVQIMPAGEPDGGVAVPVLIVNRTHVRRVMEDSPHASAPVPEPVDPAAGDEPVDPRIALLMPQPDDPASEPTAPADEAVADAEPHVEAGDASGLAMLNAALELLLEAGIIDVVEFQSIRARFPRPGA